MYFWINLLCPESAVSEIRFAWNLYICSLAEWQEPRVNYNGGPVICFSACGIQSGTVQSRCFALRIQQWSWRSHGNAFFFYQPWKRDALKVDRSQFSLECNFFTRTLNVSLRKQRWQCRHDSSISFGVKLGAVQRLSRRWSINANELYSNTASELRLKLSAWNRVTRSILTWTFT